MLKVLMVLHKHHTSPISMDRSSSPTLAGLCVFVRLFVFHFGLYCTLDSTTSCSIPDPSLIKILFVLPLNLSSLPLAIHLYMHSYTPTYQVRHLNDRVSRTKNKQTNTRWPLDLKECLQWGWKEAEKLKPQKFMQWDVMTGWDRDTKTLQSSSIITFSKR